MAMVLCTVPLRGGSHVVEAAEEEGTVLHVAVSVDSQTVSYTPAAAWESFVLSQPPSVSYSVVIDGVTSDCPALFLFGGATTTSLQPVLAWTDSGVSGLSYSAPEPTGLFPAPASVPRCVGAWSASGGLIPLCADDVPWSLPVVPFPALPPSLLSSWFVPVSLGSSVSWSPGVDVAHCTECGVTLVAPDGAPVAVSGTYDGGWTITRSASGEAVLDLLVGDFKVGEVTVTEAGGTPDAPDSTPDGGGGGPVWGTPDLTVSDAFPQFVNEAGRTSRVLESGALDDRGILWLKETSDNTSAWYGLDLSTGAFELDGQTAFYVQWLSPNDAGYAEVYAQLDDAQKSKIENGWIFLIGVEDLAGNTIQPAHPVNVYVQIGDDWDADDLNAYYIAAGGDEAVPVDYLMLDYPGGTDTFGRMTLEHFSPYIIFDELTDAEKAALELKPEDGNNQPTDKPNSSGTDSPGTGDISTELLFSGLAIVLVSSLGVMLRLITGKKKFEE